MIEGAELSAGGKAEVKSKLFFMTCSRRLLLLSQDDCCDHHRNYLSANVNIATKCLSALIMALCLTTVLLNINMTLCLSHHQTNTRQEGDLHKIES